MKRNFPVFMLLAAIAIGCINASTESSASFDLVKAKEEIEAANRIFMELVSKGDSTGVSNCYAIDAKMLAPHEPSITGRRNIEAVFGSYMKSGVAKAVGKTLAVWGTADMITEEGEMTIYITDGTQVDKGKYLQVWKKEAGAWKLFRDMYNSDLPCAQ